MQYFASLFEFAEIASVDSNAVKSAVTLQAKDFEDALQYFSAKAIGVDCIVTRNVKDFPFSELQVLTPKDFWLIMQLNKMTGWILTKKNTTL